MKYVRAGNIAAVCLPIMLQAQRPIATAKSPNDSLTVLSFRFFAAHYSGWLVAALDSIPANRYTYRPTPAQQSVGYIAQHLEDANYSLCGRLGTMRHPSSAKDSFSDTVKAEWPKDTLVARLRASVAYCDSALARLTDANLDEHVPYGPTGAGRTALPARTLLAFVTDLAEHYSQIAAYMRSMGMVPPSALPQRARTALELPASALSPYVGTYDLAASSWQDAPAVMIEITLRDSTLYIKPAGQNAVRLWPETATDFFVKEVDAQVTFTRDGRGAVTGFVLHQHGENLVARKVK